MKIILHICCAVCAAGAAERLLKEGHQVRGYFYNPNIQPEEEYGRRLEATRKVAAKLDFPLTIAEYNPAPWHAAVVGLEGEPEGGDRCLICFKMRLAATYRFLITSGGDAFTTTLTMGSNKSAALIGSIGDAIAGDTFLKYDFKKKDGFKRAGELARQLGLYRQHYCGCIYSLKEAERRGAKLDTNRSP